MLAYVFPGQGSQKVGMNAGLDPRTFAEADEALGFKLSKLIAEGPEVQLTLTMNSQPAILATSVAALRALDETPSYVAGHSLGEYTALVCAGALPFADALRLVHKRGRYMQEAVAPGAGAMAAVMALSNEEVTNICVATGAEPANFNGAGQIVIAGTAAAVAAATTLAGERGGRVIPLKVSAPFHCSLMSPAAHRLRNDLAVQAFAEARIPVIANVDARPHTHGFAALLERQVTAPVQWEATVQKLAELGVTRVVEVGPGKTLTALVKRIDKRFTLA